MHSLPNKTFFSVLIVLGLDLALSAYDGILDCQMVLGMGLSLIVIGGLLMGPTSITLDKIVIPPEVATIERLAVLLKNHAQTVEGLFRIKTVQLLREAFSRNTPLFWSLINRFGAMHCLDQVLRSETKDPLIVSELVREIGLDKMPTDLINDVRQHYPGLVETIFRELAKRVDPSLADRLASLPTPPGGGSDGASWNLP